MTSPDFSLLTRPDAIGRGVTQSFVEGRKLGQAIRAQNDQKAMREAMATLSVDPDNQEARTLVMSMNPELGMKMNEYADKRAFNNSLADFLAPQGQPQNALLGLGNPQTPEPQQNALLGQMPSNTPPSVQSAGPRPPVSQPTAETQSDAAPDLSVLGVPQTRQDQAFLKMVQRDPIRALKIKSTLRDNFVSQVEAEHDFYAFAIDEVGRTGDQASYSAALQRLMPRAQAIGVDLSAHLPSEFPGDEGIAELLERALPAKDRLAHILREANIGADNARADRNTDSLIETRDGRLDEYRRHNRASESNQRRGQNLTDSRARSRTPRARGTKPDSELPTISTPQEASRLPPGTKFRTPTGQVKVVPGG